MQKPKYVTVPHQGWTIDVWPTNRFTSGKTIFGYAWAAHDEKTTTLSSPKGELLTSDDLAFGKAKEAVQAAIDKRKSQPHP
jgi:hypothetical protein